MSNAKAKTISLLLYEGNLDGVISIEDSNWNAGELYSAPRQSVNELLKLEACKKYGVYLLLSKDKIYVGQASDLSQRITQHVGGKDWWESVLLLTTTDDSFDHADIDYLESVLINKAQNTKGIECENKTKGNKPKIKKFREVSLEQYLEEALFLMQLIGIGVFSGTYTHRKGGTLINTVDIKTALALGKRTKGEALQYLKDKGYQFNNKVSYAGKQDTRGFFWLNPVTSLIKEDWTIILNDNDALELIILHVPANTFALGDGRGELRVRSDKPYQIDIHINAKSFVEQKSEIDFRPYIIGKVSYSE